MQRGRGDGNGAEARSQIAGRVGTRVLSQTLNFSFSSLAGFERPWVWQPTPVFFLENPMDRGAWQAVIHRVTKSWTQLSNLRLGRNTTWPWTVCCFQSRRERVCVCERVVKSPSGMYSDSQSFSPVTPKPYLLLPAKPLLGFQLGSLGFDSCVGKAASFLDLCTPYVLLKCG